MIKGLTYIYALCDPETGRIRYIGKADDPKHRFRAHRHRAITGKTHKDCWIRGLANRGLEPALEVLIACPISEWREWEKNYIEVFKNEDLVNLTPGGDGASFPGEKNGRFGKPVTQETRQKISASLLGRFKGTENPFFGKKHTEETKSLIGHKAKDRADAGQVRLRDGQGKFSG